MKGCGDFAMCPHSCCEARLAPINNGWSVISREVEERRLAPIRY